MSKRAEDAALKAYPPKFTSPKRYAKRLQSEKVDTHATIRRFYQEGYERAEKDMKEWFIQFVRRHYPLNYVGWIKDFERAWEENNG